MRKATSLMFWGFLSQKSWAEKMLHFTNLLVENVSTAEAVFKRKEEGIPFLWIWCLGWLVVALGREGAWLRAAATQCHLSPSCRKQNPFLWDEVALPCWVRPALPRLSPWALHLQRSAFTDGTKKMSRCSSCFAFSGCCQTNWEAILYRWGKSSPV